MAATRDIRPQRQPRPRNETKRNLVLSALELFADKGIDAVSMRTINNAAGARNASAVHYHFGNKIGIIEAIIAFIKSELDGYRIDALKALEEQLEAGRCPTTREIMWAAFDPYYRLYRTSGYGRAALRFLARLQTDMSPDVQSILNRDPEGIVRRFDALLARALPDVPDDIRQLRYLYFWTLVVQGFSSSPLLGNTSFGDLRAGTDEQRLQRFFDYLLGGMQGAVSAHG